MQTLNQIAAQYLNGDHSIFGASSSHMWAYCPGSLIPNIQAEDDSGPDAAYGTVGHHVCETWLRTGVKPHHLIGTQMAVPSGMFGFLIDIDHAMMDFAQECVDRCLVLPGDHLVEARVDFSRLTPLPNQGGTLDHAALVPGRAVVTDHKFGQGKKVIAERNPQLMLYALGLLFKCDGQYDFREFVLRVNQPRLNHFDEWTCSRDELLEFAGFIKARAEAAWSLSAPRRPFPTACQFCKVRSTCAANALMQFKLTTQLSYTAFNEVPEAELAAWVDDVENGWFSPTMRDVATLTTEHLAALLPFKGMAEAWWKSVEKTLLLKAFAGEQIPGMKLVEGRGRRVWTVDPDFAADHLIGAGCAPSSVRHVEVCSPAESEDLLRAAGHKRKDIPFILADLIRRTPGKPTLAPVTDKRPELLNPSSMDVFDDITETGNSES